MLRILTGIISALVLTASSTALAGVREVYINAPSFCHKVERIEGNEIYLRSCDKPCALGMGKIMIKLDEAVRKVRIYSDGLFWQEQELSEFGTAQLRDLLNQADKGKKTFRIPQNIHQSEAGKKAGELAVYYRSDEFQRKVQSETERLKRDLFRIETKSAPYSDSGSKVARGILPRDERIYILISSSMPLQTVRNYVRDVAALSDPNIVIVLRGFVGGMKKVKPTLEFMKRAVAKDPECDFNNAECEAYAASFQIDPLIFRRFGIDSVPAFVYARSIKMRDPMLSVGAGENTTIRDFAVIKGDVSLSYAIEVFARETNSKFLEITSHTHAGGSYGK